MTANQIARRTITHAAWAAPIAIHVGQPTPAGAASCDLDFTVACVTPRLPDVDVTVTASTGDADGCWVTVTTGSGWTPVTTTVFVQAGDARDYRIRVRRTSSRSPRRFALTLTKVDACRTSVRRTVDSELVR